MSQMIEEDQKIRSLWQTIWSAPAQAHVAAAPDRYAIEAFRQMRPFFGVDRQPRILEVGCGTGRFCRMLAEEFPTGAIRGVDVSENSIALARDAAASKHGNLSFARASAFTLPFADNTFDVVFSQGVISLFERSSERSDFTAVREMTRVAKPGGLVLVSVPNWLCLPHTFYKWRLQRNGVSYEYGYEKSYTRRELAALLGICGLTDLRFSGFFPSYGFHRLSERCPRFSRPLRVLSRLVDRCDGPWMSRVFGFEQIAVGVKPIRPT